ncbi:hypothetical protein [Curtobacterium sp. RRHDQ10]|uniref:hypothetical protein n=1 Tax=Curtobacterium phyllosphaerae TaxID=3413379 RepID=UPI003BF0AAC8
MSHGDRSVRHGDRSERHGMRPAGSARRSAPPPTGTAQQYDPLGALGARPLVLVAVFGSLLWAVVVSVFSRDVPGSPTMSAVTVLLVGAAAGAVVVGTSPLRAPFSRTTSVSFAVLLAVATVTSVAAQWGPDTNAVNDFMALVSAVGVLVLGPYRPWREVLAIGIALVLVNGVTWGVAAAAFPTQVPVSVVVLLATAPTIVLTAAAATYAATFVAFAERVQIRAGSYSVERADRDGIARSVQQDRVTILARDVTPFFDELRTRRTITEADRERARSIADGIRRVMVADADRTWLEQAVLADGGSPTEIHDPDALIRGMDIDQRTVVRTFLRAALTDPTVDPAAITIVVERMPADPARTCLDVTMAVADSDVGIHRRFDVYLTVLRVTFPDLDVAVRPSALALRFSYDQH